MSPLESIFGIMLIQANAFPQKLQQVCGHCVEGGLKDAEKTKELASVHGCKVSKLFNYAFASPFA
jgi:hypothetical protein